MNKINSILHLTEVVNRFALVKVCSSLIFSQNETHWDQTLKLVYTLNQKFEICQRP